MWILSNGIYTYLEKSINKFINIMASLDNQLICVEYLRDNLNWDDYMCAALVGCMIAESNINPAAINKGEKNGTLTSSSACNKNTVYGTKTCPWSYGAGIIQWTFTDRKEKALMNGLGYSLQQAQNLIRGAGIESLSLQQQLQMVVGEISKGLYKTNFGVVMPKCQNLKEAVSAAYCRFLGGFSSKTTVPTDSDIKRLDKAYDAANSKTISGFNTRLKYANMVLDNYHHSIDI